MAYEDYHVNADDVKLDGDPNIRRTVPPSPSSSGGIAYGTCTTAAATAAKVVTLSDASGWELKQGATVAIKFSNTNTFSATAQAPVTLNVNDTGAKNIYYGGSANPTGTNTTAFGRANYVNTYVYDGTYWVWTGSSADNNTTYSAMSKSELTTGTATTSRVVRADYLKKGIEEIIDAKDTNFEGTRAEWEALSVAEKAKYLTMDFTDDGSFSDISGETVTFTSSDVVDANANSWTVVSPITSGLSLRTLFSRVSQMFKNVRYLYNLVKYLSGGSVSFKDSNTTYSTNLYVGDTSYYTALGKDFEKGKYLFCIFSYNQSYVIWQRTVVVPADGTAAYIAPNGVRREDNTQNKWPVNYSFYLDVNYDFKLCYAFYDGQTSGTHTCKLHEYRISWIRLG